MGLEDADTHIAEIVQMLIERGADVNATGEEDLALDSDEGFQTMKSKTPLCAAVQRRSPRLVRLLLDNGADQNICAGVNSEIHILDWLPDEGRFGRDHRISDP